MLYELSLLLEFLPRFYFLPCRCLLVFTFWVRLYLPLASYSLIWTFNRSCSLVFFENPFVISPTFDLQIKFLLIFYLFFKKLFFLFTAVNHEVPYLHTPQVNTTIFRHLWVLNFVKINNVRISDDNPSPYLDYFFKFEN